MVLIRKILIRLLASLEGITTTLSAEKYVTLLTVTVSFNLLLDLIDEEMIKLQNEDANGMPWFKQKNDEALAQIQLDSILNPRHRKSSFSITTSALELLLEASNSMF